MQNMSELQQTIERYERYVKADSGNTVLWLSLGKLYHQGGRFDAAAACFETCLQHQPGYTAARSQLALVLISQHRFAEAEASLRALVADGESDPALLHNLGLALYYQHRFKDALACFNDALARGLTIPANYAYLARTLHHLGSMQEAIDACEKWVAVANDNASRSYLSLLEMDEGNTTRARDLALAVLAKDPNDIDAQVVAGATDVERQAMQTARAHFESVLRRENDNGRAWLGLGLVHLHEQEHRQAIDALKNAVRIFPNNTGTVVTLGWAKLIAKDLVGAEQTFKQALRVDRNFAESHGGLAAALALQGKLDLAQEEIKLATRLNPQGFGAEIAKTVVLTAQGQRETATEVFDRMMQRAPQDGMPSLIEQLRIYATKKGPNAKSNPERA